MDSDCSQRFSKKHKNSSPDQLTSSASSYKDINDSMDQVEPNVSFSALLELAAYDANGFTELFNRIISAIRELGIWYGDQTSAKKRMLMEQRTPLMINATYGSADVVKFILSLSRSDVNSTCGPDKSTALHCAASSGSLNAFDVIKILLDAGANPELVNAKDCCPADVILVPPHQPDMEKKLEELLRKGDDFDWTSLKANIENVLTTYDEKKEFPIGPNATYSRDDFYMFVFKIHYCSVAYSHAWIECPYLHWGERSARRRDPRQIIYSCVQCVDFKNGQCRYGDNCGFSHGIFESGFHPTRYKTQFCKFGNSCTRKACFFAHTREELRVPYLLQGSSNTS